MRRIIHFSKFSQQEKRINCILSSLGLRDFFLHSARAVFLEVIVTLSDGQVNREQNKIRRLCKQADG